MAVDKKQATVVAGVVAAVALVVGGAAVVQNTKTPTSQPAPSVLLTPAPVTAAADEGDVIKIEVHGKLEVTLQREYSITCKSRSYRLAVANNDAVVIYMAAQMVNQTCVVKGRLLDGAEMIDVSRIEPVKAVTTP